MGIRDLLNREKPIEASQDKQGGLWDRLKSNLHLGNIKAPDSPAVRRAVESLPATPTPRTTAPAGGETTTDPFRTTTNKSVRFPLPKKVQDLVDSLGDKPLTSKLPTPTDFGKRMTEIGAETAGGAVRSTGSVLGGLQSIGDVALNAVDKGVAKLTDTPYAPNQDQIDERLTRVAERVETMAPEDKNFLDQVATGLGSTLPFLAGGVIGKAAGVPAFLGNLSMSGLESLSNAREDYKTLIADGDTEKDAQIKAVKSFGANLVLNYYTDKLGGFFESTKPGFANALKKFLTTTVFETGQETGQQAISNVATGKPFEQGLIDTALVSLPIAGLFGGIGAVNFESKEQKQLRTFIEESAKSGATKTQTANVLSVIFKVPVDQIEKVIDQHIENDRKLNKKFKANTKTEIDNIAKETTSKGALQNQANMRLAANSEEISSKSAANDPVVKEEAQKQIEDYKKEGIFLKPNENPTVTTVPADQFNGEDIGATQSTVDEKGVKKWKKRIENGERPSILLGTSVFDGHDKVRVVDGHHRLEAYLDLGFTDIPVIDNTGGKLSVDKLKDNKDNKEHGTKISNERTGDTGVSEDSQREGSNNTTSRRSMESGQRWDSVEASERISRYAGEDGVRNKKLSRQHKDLIAAKLVKVNEDTSFLLRTLGFSGPLVDSFEQAFNEGAVKEIVISDTFNDKEYVSAFINDTLYLNPDEIGSDLYDTGKIIDHELAGHSWYLKLSTSSRNEFYNNLKQSPETVKSAWEGSDNPYKNYWNRTINNIRENIVSKSSEKVADDILEFMGLTFDPDISLDTFIERSLNIDRNIEVINRELANRGFPGIDLVAEDTVAVQEHVAMIAENSGNIETNNDMINSYVNDIQENTLKYGETATNDLVYTGDVNLTLKTLQKLRGRKTTSRQYIEDLSNASDLKQQERDIIRNTLVTFEGDKIDVQEFANRIQLELLPLERTGGAGTQTGSTVRYEGVTLPTELRGHVRNYAEKIYQSHIATSAIQHFDVPNYFGHTRIEDMADNKTRRVVEVQSDLYQKGNLEKSFIGTEGMPNAESYMKFQLEQDQFVDEDQKQKFIKDFTKKAETSKLELAKLQQYNDPTAHFRMVREEIRAAAQNGKTTLLFPTGETAMKIEGLGQSDIWESPSLQRGQELNENNLAVGIEVTRDRGLPWIITEVLGDGKFKAIPLKELQSIIENDYDLYTKYLKLIGGIRNDRNAEHREAYKRAIEDGVGVESNQIEQFDISGKIDTSNPIYTFYEKTLGRYLKNNYGAEPVTDGQGVTWYEVQVQPFMATEPVVAFREKGDKPEKHPIFDTGDKLADARAALEHAEKRTGAEPVKFDIKKVRVSNKEVELPEDLQTRGLELELKGEEMKLNPIRELKKYVATGGNYRGELPEPGVIKQKGYGNKYANEFARRGDEIVHDLYAPHEVDADEIHQEFLQFQKDEIKYKEKVIQYKDDVKEFVAEKKDEIALQKIAQQEDKKDQNLSVDFHNQEIKMEDVKDIVSMIENKDKIDEITSGIKRELATKRQEVLNHKARALSKYVNSNGQLPNITGPDANTVFGRDGDNILTELGYDSIYAAQQDYNDYKTKRDEVVNPASKTKMQERYAKFLGDKKKILEAVQKELHKKGQSRKQTLNAVRDHFYLTDREMADIMAGADVRLLTDAQFDELLLKVEEKALEVARHDQAVAEVEYTIAEKNLHRVENLQLAMGLAQDLTKLNTEQLDKLNEILGYYENGDVFLGTREIETLAKNTDIPHVKTQREIIEEIITKRTGMSAEDAKAITIDWLDEFRSATSLARQNPFYEILVNDAYEIKIEAHKNYREIEKKTHELTKKARASRKRSLIDRLVPTDDLVVAYLEEGDIDVKAKIASTMTQAELELAHYIRDTYSEMRDYLVKLDMLDRVRENYYTHRPRSFLEAWLKDGSTKSAKQFIGAFARAFKETVWDVNKMEEATFKILDDRTGDVLPLEKFFKYSMKRSGQLIPSRNVSNAFLGYTKTFELKKGLDRYIPKMEAVARALTPTETTEKGLIKDESLLNFVKKWINTQKGRPTAIGPIKPGGTLDILIRSGIAFTRFLDLAWRVPAQAMSLVGEQAATFVNIGIQKQALGVFRSKTKQGKAIVKKYESFVGTKFWTKMKDQSKDAGSKMGETIFAFYGIAARNANITHLLGVLTKEEFETGNISTKRLAEIKNEMNRWRADDLLASVMGKTSVGAAFRQHKSWAVPILTQTLSDINTLSKLVISGEYKTAGKSKEFHELLRSTVLTTLLVLIIGGAYRDLKNKKDRNLVEELTYRGLNDAYSFLQALDPKTLFSVPRLASWLTGLAGALSQILASHGVKNDKGEIPGMKTLGQSFIPKIVREGYLNPKTDLEQATSSESAAEKEVRTLAVQKFEELKKEEKKGPEEAKKFLLDLAKTDEKVAKKVLELKKEETLGVTKEDKQIKSLTVKNGDQARYIYSQLSNKKTPEEKKAYLLDLAKKEILTAVTLKQVLEMEKKGTPIFPENVDIPQASIIHSVVLFARALGVDPQTAFKAMFTKETIESVKGNNVYLTRIDYTGKKGSESIAQRKASEMGVDRKTMKLDHTIPLELNGDNSERNLKLITTEEWAANTPVENYLGKKLRAKDITKSQAQEAIMRFKNKEITAEQVYATY